MGQTGLENPSPREKPGAEQRAASPEPCRALEHSSLSSSSGSDPEAPQQTGRYFGGPAGKDIRVKGKPVLLLAAGGQLEGHCLLLVMEWQEC